MQHRATRPRSRRRRILVAGLFAAVVATTATTLTTGALFSDSETVAGNVFTNGTLDVATVPATTVLTASNMAPGDVVVAPLTVKNTATLPFGYTITSTATGGLAQYLGLHIKTNVASCTAAGFSATGQDVYARGSLGSSTGQVLFGNPATGSNVGDRPLAAQASENLCFKADIPVSRSNEVAGQTATMTLTLNAEQSTSPLVTNLSTYAGFEGCATQGALQGLIAGANTSCSTANPRHGTYALRGTENNTNTTQGPYLRDLPVTAGRTYTADLYRGGPSTQPRYMRVEWINATQDAILGSNDQFDGVKGGDGWTRYTRTATAPAGAAFMRLCFYSLGASDGSGAAYDIDDVMVTEGSNTYTYADGDSPGWRWNQAVKNSTSTGPGILG